MNKNTKRYKQSLYIMLFTLAVIPFINIIFFKFSLHLLMTNLSVLLSMTIAVFYNLKFFSKKIIKMTGLFYFSIAVPISIIGLIILSHSHQKTMDIMNIYPIYSFLPMFGIGFAVMRLTNKMITNNTYAYESIYSNLKLKESERETVFNFTNNIFYDKLGNFKINFGEENIEGSSISMHKLTDSNYINKVCEFNSIKPNELKIDDLIVYDMSQI